MLKNKYIFISVIILISLLVSNSIDAQDDIFDVVEEETTNLPVIATFKTTRLVNGHSIETAKHNELDLRISHRFGNIGGEGGGLPTFYGLDNASDIRIAFEYGVSDKLTLNLGRNKGGIYDSYFKYKLLQQKEGKGMPITLTFLGSAGFNAQADTELDKNIARRLSYVVQTLIARKISNTFSAQLMPSLAHRNYVTSIMFDTSNTSEAKADNNLFLLGLGCRIRISRRSAILIDYFLPFSTYQQKFNTKDADNYVVSQFFAPLGIGYEVETGGHVFHITLSNSRSIIENEFLINTRDSWLDGHFKLGFTISRVFSLGKSEM